MCDAMGNTIFLLFTGTDQHVSVDSKADASEQAPRREALASFLASSIMMSHVSSESFAIDSR